MRQRSTMSHRFGEVPDVQISRSTFNRDHAWKGTFDSGYLVPVLVDIALPGDTFNCSATAVARLLSPLNRPVMDNVRMDFFFFSCPMRLLWTNFKRFCGEQDDPADSIDYTIPQMNVGAGIAEGSLGDYMGLPIGVSGITPNTLHFRMYNLTWNQWFRDQNIQDSVTVDLDDGPDAIADYVLLRRGRRYDYISQALPWPQKGDSVEIPLGTDAPVWGTGIALRMSSGGASYGMHADGSNDLKANTGAVDVAIGSTFTPGSDYTADRTIGLYPGTVKTIDSGLIADLSEATAATINEWREAFQLQRLLERDARGGTRYVEWIKSQFSVTSPDGRQQRVEYIGGGSAPVQFTSVPQTSESGTTKQGFLAGYGFAQKSGIGFTASFTEHMCILGLVSVRADQTFQQRLDKMWSYQTREDLYLPVLANLGEQALLTQEIMCDGSGTDDDVFGYVPRWDELRYKMSTICGALRSDAATPLDMYHLAIDYGGTAPTLNAAFLVEDPPIERIQAVTSEPDWVADIFFDYKCTRPMPVHSVPGMIDHL